MAELLTLESLFTLFMLILLQAVLGFDNLLYIAIESNKVGDPEQAKKVRKWGIAIAVLLRIVLLFIIVSLFGALAAPLFDLHLGNITLQHGETVIFDCIEFNASLSWIDVISDLAFLVMDLEQRNQTVYANQLVNQYIEHTGDYQGIALLQFYKAYRAMVRAKVAILSLQVINDQQTTNEQLANAELQANNNRLLMDRFHQYAALANRYTTPPTPFILVMHGFSGSGKSHISQSLAEQLGAIRIRTDVERKRLFSFHATANTESPVDGGIYTSQATEKTYQHVAGLASVLLKGMVPVVIDGANLKHWQRQLFSEIAKDHDVPFTIISCHADSHILQDRIVQRAARPSQDKERDASEAKLETLAHQQRFSDPLSNEEFGVSIQVNTGQSNRISSIVEQINKCLNINTKLV